MHTILFTLVFYSIFFIVLLVLLLVVSNVVIKMLIRRNKQLTRRLYLKVIPFTLNYHSFRRTNIIGEFLGIVILTAIIAYIIFANVTPLGITVPYDLNAKKGNITPLGPKNRVSVNSYYGQSVSKVTDDLVYFTTNFPFNFDTATVKVYFQNASPNQTFMVGFQDQPIWHYDLKPFDVPFLNNFNWQQVGNDPTLYQSKPIYKSVDDFLTNPPHNAIIGKYAYPNDIGDPSVIIPNYKPSSHETVIDTPLRGNQVIYAYLDHEPFHMTIVKQDLNWYKNPDTVKVSVYKDNDLVYETTAADDGITNSSRRVKQSTEINIANPGPGLPESGVYKIVIDANSDTIIKRIKTNLHKIVFANSIFPAANSQVYGQDIASTSATTVYTNALSLTALTYHTPGEQIITVGNKQLDLNKLNVPVTISPPDTLTKAVIPQNDVILNGFQGYFSFSPDEFFMPSQYYVMPINTKSDLGLINYLITDYQPSHIENGWRVNEQTFDLSTANTKNGRLSWVIDAPQLKENGNSLIIKDIQITFHKKGWLN